MAVNKSRDYLTKVYTFLGTTQKGRIRFTTECQGEVLEPLAFASGRFSLRPISHQCETKSKRGVSLRALRDAISQKDVFGITPECQGEVLEPLAFASGRFSLSNKKVEAKWKKSEKTGRKWKFSEIH